jgi:ketosteroid isomerase-like protein
MPARSRNVEAALKGFEAFERRDAEGFIRYATADCEWRPFLTASVEGGVYRGAEGIRRWFANVDGMFESFSVELAEVRDLGDRVVMLGTLRGRGRGSGVPVESRLGIVVEFDGEGLCTRASAFASHGEALAHAAAGAP